MFSVESGFCCQYLQSHVAIAEENSDWHGARDDSHRHSAGDEKRNSSGSRNFWEKHVPDTPSTDDGWWLLMMMMIRCDCYSSKTNTVAVYKSNIMKINGGDGRRFKVDGRRVCCQIGISSIVYCQFKGGMGARGMGLNARGGCTSCGVGGLGNQNCWCDELDREPLWQTQTPEPHLYTAAALNNVYHSVDELNYFRWRWFEVFE